MADKETGFNITIGAVADEASAKKAVQDITKGVLNALKDGYIEIPTAISDKFDKSKASDKLIRAQEDFINQWKKMSAEGFSSSEKDLKDFVDKFVEFKRLMGKEGKGGSKQNLALKSLGLENIVKSYKNAAKQLQVKLNKINAKQDTTQLNKSTSKSTDNTTNKLVDKLNSETKTQTQNIKNVSSAVKDNTSSIEKQTQYDIIENSAERTADSATIEKAQEDLTSGFNTDRKADEAINAINNISENGVKEDSTQKNEPQKVEITENTETNKGELPKSNIFTSVKNPHSWVTKLRDSFAALTHTTANYKKIMSATSEEQDNMNAQLIKQFGLISGTDGTSGDKIRFGRRMALWRGKGDLSELFKGLTLSKGVRLDTTAITDKLAKVLSGAEMFKAQTGGFKNNLIAAGTAGLAYTWQPSLEKTRAQADGINQIMANIREVMNQIVQDILDKESALRGLAEGEVAYKKDGSVDFENSSAEAQIIIAQLENAKLSLAQVLADVGMVDQVVDRTGGKLGKIVQRLGFTAPMLRKNNAILANLNAGLDKSGKALKFQTRMGEILNYSFQLIGRHIGQIFKGLVLSLNPISALRKAFSDFAGYDVKWQRTMNVIKYNLRRIIRPFMEWFAQQLVNILGIINAIIKGVGQAFGQDWDLFDQSAASAEQMREELEQAQNITAGFDELHDIGTESSSNPAMDLMGDIYKPEWGDLYDTITEKAKKLTKFLIPIFEKLGKVIKWCFDHWKLLVAAFLAFKLAKGLLKLLSWAKSLKDVLSAIGGAGVLGKLLSVLSIVAGVALAISTQKGTAELADEWDRMSKEDRWKKIGINMGKGIASGALIGAGIGGLFGGPIGAAVGAGLGAAVGGLKTGYEQLKIVADNGNDLATMSVEQMKGWAKGRYCWFNTKSITRTKCSVKGC